MRRRRLGLRSAVKDAARRRLSSGGEETATERPSTSEPSTQSSEGMASMMRDFLKAQQTREELFLRELRGLRESIRPTELTTPSPSRVSTVETSPPPTPPPPIQSTDRRAAQTRRPETPMPPLQPGDDIESYLRRFERLARTWQWPREEWSCRLVPLLTGRALEAYLAMDEVSADDYVQLKDSLLQKYDISAETYRQRFRAATLPEGESPTETYHRLRHLYQRWVRPDQNTKEEIGEQIIMEQLLRVMQPDARTWVKEHEPNSGLTAAKLAQQYMNAHRPGLRTQPSKGRARHTFHNTDNQHSHELETERSHTLICYACQQKGHKASVCPARKSKLTGFCYAPREGDANSDFDVGQNVDLLDITVNGFELKALLDTGSSISLIKSCHVFNVDYTNTTEVQCIHGDIKRYPKAEVLVGIQDQMYLMNVAVVTNLPTDMILGRDLPVLNELCVESTKKIFEGGNVDEITCTVMTRSKAGLQPLPDLDSSLLQGGTKAPKKTRQQKRLLKHLGSPVPKPDTSGLEVRDWQIPENIAELYHTHFHGQDI
ncbi:uncharacterized protein LOC130216836 [Danio aesculapii]|uniref:uncharacterized protein LOC130216836 n=1 Tax=Danio aesculapii TaxID=1142201 RepID=UPI0024C02E4F|nr:uncharacterized protein LOC130216836 [Danio aesculapii]